MLWVTMTSWLPPIAVAAASAPSLDDWLNDLSSSCPTSVTTPTFSGAKEPAASDAGADAGAEAGADAGADGLGVAPPPQAATRMARPPNRDRPMERWRMCPPHKHRDRSSPAGRALRGGPARSRRTFAPAGRPLRRILATGSRPGK